MFACQGVSTGNSSDALASRVASLSFGNVQVGNKQTLSETVTNTGSSSITVSELGLTGPFNLSGPTTPLMLAAGQSTSFSVTFAPTAAGIANGNLIIASNASNSKFTIPLSGTGTTTAGQLNINPNPLAVGNVVVGTSGTASGNVTAPGTDVTITAASTNNAQFSIGGISLPATIPSGQSIPFTVTFSPQVSGAATATLTFTSSAQSSTTTETLTGTGTPAPTHSVSLSWNASSSANVSGYNIYRAVYTNSCGSFSRINSLLNTSTLYTDSAVTDGTSYCYATTAVNTNNQESTYSNIASPVQIPAP